jgi:hypothetical protein
MMNVNDETNSSIDSFRDSDKRPSASRKKVFIREERRPPEYVLRTE